MTQRNFASRFAGTNGYKSVPLGDLVKKNLPRGESITGEGFQKRSEKRSQGPRLSFPCFQAENVTGGGKKKNNQGDKQRG